MSVAGGSGRAVPMATERSAAVPMATERSPSRGSSDFGEEGGGAVMEAVNSAPGDTGEIGTPSPPTFSLDSDLGAVATDDNGKEVQQEVCALLASPHHAARQEDRHLVGS